MSIEHLHAGGVAGVTLKGQGAAFLVQIASRSGTAALLAKARSTEPRRFGNPGAALNMLRDLGITIGRFDGSEWNPHQKQEIPGNRGRAEVMRKSHEAEPPTTNGWRAKFRRRSTFPGRASRTRKSWPGWTTTLPR